MRNLLVLSAAVLLSACAHKVDTAGAASFGASVEAAHNAQTVPGQISGAAPEGSAAVGALAQERYQSGRIRPLMPTTTSSANSTTN